MVAVTSSGLCWAQSFILVSVVGGSGPNILAIFCCLSQTISRELSWKWSYPVMDQHYREYLQCRQQPNVLRHISDPSPICLYSWKVEWQIISSPTCSFLQMLVAARVGTGQNQELHVGLRCGDRKCLLEALQEPRSETKWLELVLAPW